MRRIMTADFKPIQPVRIDDLHYYSFQKSFFRSTYDRDKSRIATQMGLFRSLVVLMFIWSRLQVAIIADTQTKHVSSHFPSNMLQTSAANTRPIIYVLAIGLCAVNWLRWRYMDRWLLAYCKNKRCASQQYGFLLFFHRSNSACRFQTLQFFIINLHMIQNTPSPQSVKQSCSTI